MEYLNLYSCMFVSINREKLAAEEWKGHQESQGEE